MGSWLHSFGFTWLSFRGRWNEIDSVLASLSSSQQYRRIPRDSERSSDCEISARSIYAKVSFVPSLPELSLLQF